MKLNVNLTHPLRHKALVDFLVETMHREELNPWMLFVDRSSTNEGSGARVVLLSPQGEKIKLVIWLHFRASN